MSLLNVILGSVMTAAISLLVASVITASIRSNEQLEQVRHASETTTLLLKLLRKDFARAFSPAGSQMFVPISSVPGMPNCDGIKIIQRNTQSTEYTAVSYYSNEAGIWVERVGDAFGEPQSSTARLPNSNEAGWKICFELNYLQGTLASVLVKNRAEVGRKVISTTLELVPNALANLEFQP